MRSHGFHNRVPRKLFITMILSISIYELHTLTYIAFDQEKQNQRIQQNFTPTNASGGAIRAQTFDIKAVLCGLLIHRRSQDVYL